MIKNLKYISLLFVLSACVDVGDRPESADETADSELIADAKMFMEEYSARELDYTLEGLHPGAYSPVWNKAVTLESAGFEIVNVPISSEATYEATMYTNPEEKDEEETYHTAIAQKLVIQRDVNTGEWSCFMLSLIPDATCSTDNRMNVSNMFVCGSDETKFSGIVVYSTVTTNFTAQIDIYVNGELQKSLSVYDGAFDWSRDFKQMSEMISIKSLTRNVRAISRSGDEFGGWGSGITLPEIVVPGGGGNGGGTGGGDIPSLPNPPDPPFPNFPSNPDYPSNHPPYYPPYNPPSTGGNTSGSTSQDNVTAVYIKESGDKLVRDGINLYMIPQMKGLCVIYCMNYIDTEIFGGKISLSEFAIQQIKTQNEVNIINGATTNGMIELYKTFFDIEKCSSIRSSINSGFPVVCAIQIDQENYHNIVAVGYRQNGKIIYIDPALGFCMVAPSSLFSDPLYKFTVKKK